MPPRFLLTSGLVLSLTACNLAPDYHPPLVNVPADYKEIGPWQPAQPADAAPRGPWWQQLGDPTLDRLEPQIDKANPDLAATVARYDQARAAAVEAEAGLYPQISLGASSIANRQSSKRPLRAGGPNQYTANTLDTQESATYATFREASEDYRSTVLGAFQEVEDNLALIHWLGTETNDENAAVAAAQRTLDSALDLHRQGATSYLEVVTAQTALLQSQQGAIDVQTRQFEAEVGLARALGGGWKATALPSDSAVTELPANG